MDAFTEKILARARERQKMLEGYSSAEKTPLCETNNTRESKVIHKEYVSDPVVNKKTVNPECTLKENKSDSHLASFSRQNSRTRVSSDLSGSPKTQLKTLNIQKENFNMEIKLSSTDNVRVEVEINETDDSIDGDHEEVGMRDEAKNKLRRLGKLYSGCEEDISSPIHKSESKFYEENFDQEERIIGSCQKSPRKGLSKLARLAETINQWEDEVKKSDAGDRKFSSRKPLKPLAPQPPLPPPSKESPLKPSHKYKASESPTPKYFDNKSNEDNEPILTEKADQKYNLENEIKNDENISCKQDQKLLKVDADKVVKPKKLNWDPKVLDKLESQGFTRTTSNARLIYSYNQHEKYAQSEQTEIQVGGMEAGKIKQLANMLENMSNCNKERLHDYSESNQNSLKEKINSSKINLRSNVTNKAALFETTSNSSPKDPALLSVSERKALFEKNKGEALIPKAAFAMSVPSKVEFSTKPVSTNIITEMKMKPSETTTTNIDTIKPIIHAPPKSPKTIANRTPVKNVTADAVVDQGKGISSTLASLLNKKSTISQEQIESSIKMQKQKDMEMLLNRFNRPTEVSQEPLVEESDEDEVDVSETTSMIPNKSTHIVSSKNNVSSRSAEKRKSGEKAYGNGDSQIVTAVLDEVKRIKVSPAKPGRLYPNLSDIEATTETETDNQTRTPTPDGHSSCEDNNYESDDPNTSFGRDILEAVCKNQTSHKRPIYDESTESDLSSILEDADDEYLEELPGEQEVNIGPTRPKQVRHIPSEKATAAQPSNSFHYKNFNENLNNTTENEFLSPSRINMLSQNPADLPEYILEGENILPLTHTVSFYRKQQNQVNTPVRQIARQPIIEGSPEKIADDMEDVQIKIRSLEEEVSKQQNIISQTSQALNLCISTPEFSGSTEQVEAERVLLVATHRRQSALLELQRLRVEQTIRPQGQGVQNVPLEKGTLSISNIILPLKHKYVKALAAAGGKGHHIVCLIKCAEQVVPTGLVSTIVCNTKNPDTEVKIPGTVVLNDVYSDFTVTFEVYCLQAQEEFLPHEVKYHINNKKSNNKLVTPKKSKQDSRMVMPIKESPGGPQAVRSSSFAMNGYVVFSLQAINRKNWSLNNTPTMSPLEGSVEMRIHCELAVSVEHRGFLTMFEDISGLGAWHRRWCLLLGHTLSYWKYPDDERKMAPIDTINLKNCITKQVGPVSREICARLHTFLLERERTAHPKDKNSLVTVCNGDKTIIRHLLSADTKEERIEWCSKLNAALTTLKM